MSTRESLLVNFSLGVFLPHSRFPSRYDLSATHNATKYLIQRPERWTGSIDFKFEVDGNPAVEREVEGAEVFFSECSRF